MRLLFTGILIITRLISLGQSKLVEDLNKQIIEVKALSPDSSFADLGALHEIVKDKSIIGLGEATHATREFFVYKHRLIKYLVTHENFKVFVIEGDFAGSQAMYDYVVDGKGTINDALYGIGFVIWMTEEFVDLIKWMREYNTGKLLEDKIKFYGCDINNKQFAAKKMLGYLTEIECMNPTLQKGLDWMNGYKYQEKRSKEEEQLGKRFLLELEVAFKTMQVEKSREYEIMVNCKRELEQFFELCFSDEKESIVLRDQFMGENIKRIYDLEGRQNVIFWAHNEHIKNDKVKCNQKPAGYYLKKEFGEKYYSFGFGFNQGKVGGYNWKEKKYEGFGIPEMSSKKLCDAVFDECAYSNFILDFKSAQKSEVINKFLNKNQFQRTIGNGFHADGSKYTHFRMGKLIDKYDGYIFIQNSNPITRLKREVNL